jgi:hypothetical protein
MTIQVENLSFKKIEVCINRWAEDVDTSTDYFLILHNGTETWKRTSEYGYVMSVKHPAEIERQYYVMADRNYLSEMMIRKNL